MHKGLLSEARVAGGECLKGEWPHDFGEIGKVMPM